MTRWTQENTEGFAQDDLDTLNEAQTMLEADAFAWPQNIADMLNNAWMPGATAAELCASARGMLT